MEFASYIKFILNFFEKHKVKVSEYAMRVFSSKKFLNRVMLEEMSDKDIKKSLKEILNDILQKYKEREKKAVRPTSLRDIDVRPVIRNKFCNLPPFCKYRKQ